MSLTIHPTQQTTETKTARGSRFLLLLVVVLACAVAAYFFTRPAEKKAKPKLVAPITTAVAVLKDMPLQLRSIGNVVPMESVSASINNAKAQILADEANLQNALAQLSAAKAILENARVQLNYTTVNSPISGRTGRILVLLGNNVRADEDVLVTINQIVPIYVEFSVPSEQFELVQKYGKESLGVTVFLKNEKVTRQGKVTFTDNTVDSTTGTVKLKAVFTNADSALWPGKYVDVILTLTTLRNALAVPDQAVQTGQAGQLFGW